MKDIRDPQVVAQFLVAEYNALQERARHFEEIQASRVNFFLLIVAAFIAGLPALSKVEIIEQNYPESGLIAAFILLLLGLSVLQHLVYLSGAGIVFHRRAGRIRRWFVDFDRSISDYVAFRPSDDNPEFNLKKYTFGLSFLWSGIEPIVVIINVLSVVAIFCCISLILSAHSALLFLLAAPISAILAWVLQIQFLNKTMKIYAKMEEGKIRFPYKNFLMEEKLDEEHKV